MKPTAKRYLKVLLNLTLALIVLLLVIFLLPKVLVFFLPFLIGYIIAMIASPIVKFFDEKLKVRRKAASALVIIAVLGLVIFGIYLVGAKLFEQIVGLTESLPRMLESAESDISQVGKNLNVFFERLPEDMQNTLNGFGEKLDSLTADIIGKLGTPTISAVGNFAKQLPNILIAVIMALLSAYFFVADKEYMSNFYKTNVPPFVQTRCNMIMRSLKRAVGGYFKAQFKIEIFVYIMLVIGLSVLGVEYAILLSIGIAFLDLLPFFGTGTVMVPWAIIKFFNADYVMAIGLLVIWGAGQILRQVIQPKIVGDSVGVAPIPTLFLLYIGYKFGGVIGMIIAVPIGIIVINMNEEGVFDTTKNSVRILFAQLNRFRRLEKEDLEILDKEDE